MRIIFAADDPLVLNGTYDREGFTPKERRAQARRQGGCDHKFIDSRICLKCGWAPEENSDPDSRGGTK